MVGLLLGLGMVFGAGGDVHNHPDVQWHTLETEHFSIHWPQSSRVRSDPHWFTTTYTAGRIAHIAEQVYPKICARFNTFVEEKTHIVVYDQDVGWAGNGFAVPQSNWIAIGAGWGPVYRPRGRSDYISDVVGHEFAHIVSLKAAYSLSQQVSAVRVGGLVQDDPMSGLNTPFSTDFGFEFQVSAHTPFWWAEGGAEHVSERAGVNEWGAAREAFLRTTVAEERVLSLDEWASARGKTGFELERGYSLGHGFFRWLQTAVGPNSMADMAKVNASGWRASWEGVVHDATGSSLEALYTAWRAHLDQHYGSQIARIRGEGFVEGSALALVRPLWEARGGGWEGLSKQAQDSIMDGHVGPSEYPSTAPDGQYMAWFDQGLNIRHIQPMEWGAIGGSYVGADDDGALARWAKKTTGAYWAVPGRVAWAPDSREMVVVGPEDFRRGNPVARWAMDNGLQVDLDGKNWSQLIRGKIRTHTKELRVDWAPIPNTLRAVEAAWSPDGKTIAFSRYSDGGHNLVAIAPDGSGRRQLTDFDDGTQIQGISWLADSSAVVMALYHGGKQDLWLYKMSDDRLYRLTQSSFVETEPVVGPEGLLWFSSDRDGVYNVYTLDFESGEVARKTNLLGGAHGVDPAKGGHLFYTAVTGHGVRIQGMREASMLDEVVAYGGMCQTSPTPCVPAETHWAVAPLTVDAKARSHRYRAPMMPVSGWPVLLATEHNIEAGAGFYVGDYAEKHQLEGRITLGEDKLVAVSYWNNQLWPTLNIGAKRYTQKQLITQQPGAVLKTERAQDDVWLYGSYVASDTLWVGVGVQGRRFGVRGGGLGLRWKDFSYHSAVGGFLDWTPWMDTAGDPKINPHAGRHLFVDYTRRQTRVLGPQPEGQPDGYAYNQFMGSYTEYIPLSLWGLWGWGTLELALEAGVIDRNVMALDEFKAGGRHPYHWGNGAMGSEARFSGYGAGRLTGETMVIGAAAYRFPLARNLGLKMGPLYTEAVYLQVFGTVGNLWPYRLYGADFRVLSDVGAELRVQSFVWNDFDWNSFARVAYGAAAVAGNPDVYGGRILGDGSGNRIDPPGVHVYIGLGTGW